MACKYKRKIELVEGTVPLTEYDEIYAINTPIKNKEKIKLKDTFFNNRHLAHSINQSTSTLQDIHIITTVLKYII